MSRFCFRSFFCLFIHSAVWSSLVAAVVFATTSDVACLGAVIFVYLCWPLPDEMQFVLLALLRTDTRLKPSLLKHQRMLRLHPERLQDRRGGGAARTVRFFAASETNTTIRRSTRREQLTIHLILSGKSMHLIPSGQKKHYCRVIFLRRKSCASFFLPAEGGLPFFSKVDNDGERGVEGLSCKKTGTNRITCNSFDVWKASPCIAHLVNLFGVDRRAAPSGRLSPRLIGRTDRRTARLPTINGAVSKGFPPVILPTPTSGAPGSPWHANELAS